MDRNLNETEKTRSILFFLLKGILLRPERADSFHLVRITRRNGSGSGPKLDTRGGKLSTDHPKHWTPDTEHRKPITGTASPLFVAALMPLQ